MTHLADGLHELNREAYDRLTRVNWSTLKWMDKSAAHYLHACRQSFEDTDPKRRGRAVHLAVFEPELFRANVVRWEEGVARRGKAWEAFCVEHLGKEILTADGYDTAAAIAEAVRADPVAAPFLVGGRPELAVLWTHDVREEGELLPRYQVECKGRLDFVLTEPGPIVDLKTTRDASPEGFGRQAWLYRYDAQAALYQDGLHAVTGVRRPYVLIAVEEAPPHAVAVYRVPDAALAGGRDHYRQLLARVAECRARDVWPGYCESVRELELPRWAMPWLDEDLTEAGLEFGGL